MVTSFPLLAHCSYHISSMAVSSRLWIALLWTSSSSLLLLLLPLLPHSFMFCAGVSTRYYDFQLQNSTITKLCKTRNIITVNGQFPGPTIFAEEGDRMIIRVSNAMQYNVTLHWHGVRQHFSCWWDGPSYITQCPIQPGATFTYEFTLYQQKGTLWWHAHISWLRATVNGAFVIYPQTGKPYPFPSPHQEHVIIIGEWWNADPEVLEQQIISSGGPPNVSDAYLLNGHPGPLYSCSAQDVYKLEAKPGKTYKLRLINAALNQEHFFGVANHTLTVVAVDGEYTKPFNTSAILITPGQTADVLLTADPACAGSQYYMGVGPYMFANVSVNNVSALGIFSCGGAPSSLTPAMPALPGRNDSAFILRYMASLRSLSIEDNAEPVPQTVDKSLLYAVGLNLNACPSPNKTCGAPNNTIVQASMNNVTFQRPSLAMLQAYYFGLNGSFTPDFPTTPLQPYDYTSQNPVAAAPSLLGTKADVIDFDDHVQMVLQGTSLVSTENHPIHLHGYSFYVVGLGTGNFSEASDPPNFNLVDPPLVNTVGVPAGGWAAIRFKANNPGVWFMHCHLEIHTSWGLASTLIVKNGQQQNQMLPPPPKDLPQC